MFVAARARGSTKLRRSGMNGAGDSLRTGHNSCRSYGARLGVLAGGGYKHGAPNGAWRTSRAERTV